MHSTSKLAELAGSELCLHELIERQARQTPNQAALVFEGQRLTYAQLDARSNQLAHRLKELGAGPDLCVGLYLERSLELVIGILGILKAGAAYLPIDPSYPQERIAFMLRDSEARLAVTQTSLMKNLPKTMLETVCLDALSWPELPELAQPAACSPTNPAYVIYTSGSTGRPKGVGIEHRNIVNYVLGVSQRLQLESGMQHATVSTIAADLGNTVLFPALATGGCLHVIAQERVENQYLLAEYFEREQIDVLKIVPSHLAALQSGRDPQRVMPKRLLVLGGEASRVPWIERLRELAPGCEIFNHYGPTETTVGALTYHVESQLPATTSGTLPLGKPLPNTHVYVLDEHRQEVAFGREGELYIGGAGVGRGYINRSELTEERFLPDPFSPEPGARMYRSGDLARRLADGNIEFCGRVDDQVKIRGYRVEPGEIESALREHPGVRDVVVCASEGEPGTKRLAAYIVPTRPMQPLWEHSSVYILPDGAPVAHLNKNETDYIYHEIFQSQAYLRNGITIRDGDTIVDAGANIGLFTVFANRVAKNLHMVAIEPNPAAYACLKTNAETWGEGVKCLPVGLWSENKTTAEFTVFKGMSLLSGFYADESNEREVVKNYVLNQQPGHITPPELAAELGAVIDEKFQPSTIEAQLRKLSDILAEEGIEHIDLLKVNVEKSELDVLKGIDDDDWAKIRQIVIEVDRDKNLAPIAELLKQHGYEYLVEQDPLLRKTELRYVYAIRPSEGRRLCRQPADRGLCPIPPPDAEIMTPKLLRNDLKARLPQHMVPSIFVLKEKIPLTANGKIDRQQLSALSSQAFVLGDEFVEPSTATEKALAAIWAELLKVERIGTRDDFFDLGGSSLEAIQVVSRVRDIFGVDVPIRAIFDAPTIEGLAGLLSVPEKAEPQGLPLVGRANGDAPCALSLQQESFWLLNQLAPESAAYNAVDVARFAGAYDRAAMQRAMQALIQRHQILRTGFSPVNGEPRQLILPRLEIDMGECDLSLLSPAECEQAWKILVREDGRKPFDLSQPPLLRATMAHFSPQEHRLLLTIHHIIADEWSMELVQKELPKLYEAYRHGEASPLAPLPIQYQDFAIWQREQFEGETARQQLAYWRKELAGAPCMLELPNDRPRPPVKSFDGATETFALPRSLVERLKALARGEQASLFMAMAASFIALLHRYTGQDDLLIGTPISGRTRPEAEQLIGCFLNTILLRANFAGKPSFRSLLCQVRERVLGAFAHAELPFHQLVAELARQRDPSRSPMFDVLFIMHHAGGMSEISKISGMHELENGTSKFDLTLFVTETNDGMEGLFEYSTALFDAATIGRMCRHYTALLESMAANPDRSVVLLPMLSEDEHRQQLRFDTAVEWPQRDLCVHQLIEQQARSTPGQTAVVFENRSLSYEELNRRADHLGGHLRRLGVGPDVLVGLCVERSLEMLVGVLGILKAGGAYVPLDPSFPAKRLDYMVEDSRMAVLVMQRGLEEHLSVLPPKVVLLDSDSEAASRLSTPTEYALGNPIEQSAAPDEAPRIRPEHLAYVLYTSGSTGRPKGVAIPHSALTNFLLSMRERPGFSSRDTLLAVTTLSFDIAGLELHLPLICGGKVVIGSREDALDPARLAKRIAQTGCTMMQATPATWRALIQAGWSGSPNLKLLCGGEALLTDLARELLPRCAELWNMYGPTETTVWSTIHRIRSAEAPVPIGRLIANTQVYVLDAHQNLIPRGHVGELYIGGSGLARGYWGRDELTRERFISSPFVPGARLYRTGDLARWLPDGLLECLGRIDQQVKLRGYRIELGEIESLLNSHPAIRQSAVMVRQDGPGEAQLVAYVEPARAEIPTASELRRDCEKELPGYMVPAVFVSLEKLPLTANGKVDRKALPAPTLRLAATAGYLAPRDATEQMLARLWAKALNIKRVGVYDNFFDLGGHSLLAVRVMTELSKQTRVRLPLAALLQSPTIAELAKNLHQPQWKPVWSALVPLRTSGSKPPLFLMHAHGGNVLEYHALAELLGPDQPVYALQAHGLDGNLPTNLSIEGMAKSYIEELKSVQPEGPYFLAGFCFGGLLALEMAAQLTDAEEEVALVSLIQTMHPEAARWKPEVSKFQRVWYPLAKRLDLEWENFSHSRGTNVMERLRRAWDIAHARVVLTVHRLAHRKPKDFSRLPKLYLFEAIGDAHADALRGYAPRSYDGPVVLFRASRQLRGLAIDEHLGWKRCLNGSLEVQELSGHQQNLMLVPNVRQLAAALGSRLNAAQQRYGKDEHAPGIEPPEAAAEILTKPQAA